MTRVEIGLRIARGLRLATLRSLTGPRVARRGSTISVRATLRRPGGAVTRRTIRVAIPRGMPAGPRDLFLKGTEADVALGEGGDDGTTTIDLSSLFETDTGEAAPGPGSVAALADTLSDLHRYDGVTARLLPPGASVPEQLPGGAEGVAQRPRRVFRDAAPAGRGPRADVDPGPLGQPVLDLQRRRRGRVRLGGRRLRRGHPAGPRRRARRPARRTRTSR